MDVLSGLIIRVRPRRLRRSDRQTQKSRSLENTGAKLRALLPGDQSGTIDVVATNGRTTSTQIFYISAGEGGILGGLTGPLMTLLVNGQLLRLLFNSRMGYRMG